MKKQSDQKINDILFYTTNLKELDGFVKIMREHLAHEGKSSFWRIKPFINFGYTTFKFYETSSTFDKIFTLLVNPASILITSFLGIANVTDLISVPILKVVSSNWWFLIAGILYISSVIKGFVKQLDYSDNNFDLNAFRSTFPVLYQQLRVFKNTEPFSFELLHSHVERLSEVSFTQLGSALEEISNLSAENRELNDRLAYAEALVLSLDKKLALTRSLFDKAITALQAENNDAVTKDILHTFTDFALFKLEGDNLITVATHHAYNTPDKISVLDRKDWAVVKAAFGQTKEEYLQVDQSHDRVVIASKFILHGDTYVYSYHLPSRRFDEVAKIATDIDMQTLLYNLILLYNKKKGGNLDGDN